MSQKKNKERRRTVENLKLETQILEDLRTPFEKIFRMRVPFSKFLERTTHFTGRLHSAAEKEGAHSGIIFVMEPKHLANRHNISRVDRLIDHCAKQHGGDCFKVGQVIIDFPVDGLEETSYLYVNIRHSLNCEQHKSRLHSRPNPTIGGKVFGTRGLIFGTNLTDIMNNLQNSPEHLVITKCNLCNHFFICENEKNRTVRDYYNENFKPVDAKCTFQFNQNTSKKYSLPSGCSLTQNNTGLICAERSNATYIASGLQGFAAVSIALSCIARSIFKYINKKNSEKIEDKVVTISENQSNNKNSERKNLIYKGHTHLLEHDSREEKNIV